MDKNFEHLREHIAVRSLRLAEIASELKAELVGIDGAIDRAIESVRAWYVLPEIITRPVIVCLWGLTGTGKTQLTRLMARKLGFYDRFVEVQMDGFSNGYASGNTLSGLLCESGIEEGAPGILVLDEFQRFRTIDALGEDIKVERYMDVWALLSDGRLSPSIAFIAELERSIADALYYEDRKKSRKDDGLKTKGKDAPAYNLSPHEAADFKQSLKLKEPVMEIMRWTLDEIHGRTRVFREQEQHWDTDYSRLLIFVCGNLDEMYEDTAKRITDCDTDADIFHVQTKALSMIDVKRALGQRFKPEQIARLGNNHVIFASFSRASFEKLIAVTCQRYLTDIRNVSGIQFTLAPDLMDEIYANSVFPAQGTRPVFSSIHAVLSAPLVSFTLWALEHGARAGEVLAITVDAQRKNLLCHFRGTSHLCPVAFELNGLKQRTDANFRALLAVHEAGHALVYCALYGHPPQELKINVASFKGGYNSYCAVDAESGRNILDKVCVCLGGFAAETLVFGVQARTSGSESDIKKATQFTAGYVRQLGLGSRLGKVDVASESGENINTDVHPTNCEIEDLLQLQLHRADQLLRANRQAFTRITRALETHGQVSREELADWLQLPVHRASSVLEPYAQLLRQFGAGQAGADMGVPGLVSADATGIGGLLTANAW
jgi:cell division protease FtsH